MSSPSRGAFELSPKKRALLEARLKREGLERPGGGAIPRRASEGPAPLSFAQQRLWFLDRLMGGASPVYNIPVRLRLQGPLDASLLERASNEVVRRHQVLRASFALSEGEPVQVVAPELWVPLPVVDLSGLTVARRDQRAEAMAFEELERPFNLDRPPLMRTVLLHLASDDHVLLVAMHHIISEAWSINIFFREVKAIYEAFRTGRPSPLAELPIQYGDFAAWQRDQLRGEFLHAQLDYWKRQLGGAPPVLELATDHPRPAIQTFVGAVESRLIPVEVVEAARVVGQQERATVFMLLLAAFQALLSRYTGQEDILVGSPIVNRSRTELEGLIGFFVNTLVLRADLSGSPTFSEALRRVRETALGAYSHQELPFEMLVEELRPERDMSHTPLVQVMFALQNTPPPVLELPGITVTPLPIPRRTAKFDITLEVTETGRGWLTVLEYNTDLFDASTAARMLSHYENLLRAAAGEPERPLSALPLLSEGERHRLLVEWNATAAPEAGRCIHQVVAERAALRPGDPAVSSDGRILTYGELDGRANRLARFLRQHGVGPEVVVAVVTERSLEMVVGLLGVLKAGGAYAPLDPAYPAERLAFMLEDTAAPVVLTQQALRGTVLPEGPAKVLCLNTGWDAVAAECDEPLEVDVRPDNLAYVIYTSGSTGLPKGVEITHRGLMNLVCWHEAVYGVTPADRATQLAGPAFDASVWEIWPYLGAGASVHIPDEDTRSTPAKLLRWLAHERITLTFLPTPLAEAVLEEPWPEGMALRGLLTGGDKLHKAPPRGLPCVVYNHYGPTENSVVTTWTALEPEAAGAPPIGRPVWNTQVYVLDQAMQPVPVGVPGELLIGGVGLARGYLRRPALTAEKFVPNPFGEEGARLYRTGDLVRYRPDAQIEFLGRIDLQVKLRGFRIELGEIEYALARHPDIRAAVVLLREDPGAPRQLVAYVVLQPGTAEPDLRAHLKRSLADHMVPVAFVILEELPLTPNGKVDRRALPRPASSPALHGDHVPAHTPTERAVAEVWGELLAIDRISVHDNFFDLGGHSLLGMKALHRIEQRLGVTVRPADLMLETLGQIAARCDRSRGESRPPRGLASTLVGAIARMLSRSGSAG